MWQFAQEILAPEAVGSRQDLLSAANPGGTLLALSPLDESGITHMRRVESLAGRAAAFLGVEQDELFVVRRAALLHDYGKMLIPPSILNKPARLNDAEWRIVRRHPKLGATFLSRAGEPKRVCEAVATHHEHWDGGGYPSGLAGEGIPVVARLIAVADAYDAMMNDRPYRRALGHDEAIEELASGSGKQFDPDAVEALEAVLFRATGTGSGALPQAMAKFT